MKEKVVRKSIVREPIKLSMSDRIYIENERVLDETVYSDVRDIFNYYNSVLMIKYDMFLFRNLPETDENRGKKYKNYKYFEAIYYICRAQKWNPQIYIDAQFDRASKYFKNIKFPTPAMMISTAAMKHYITYYGEYKSKYQKGLDWEKRKRGKETLTPTKIILSEIESSMKFIASRLTSTNEQDRIEEKAVIIYENWNKLSKFYLCSVTWFVNMLKEEDNKELTSLISSFDAIGTYSVLGDTIYEYIKKLEKELNIPTDLNT